MRRRILEKASLSLLLAASLNGCGDASSLPTEIERSAQPIVGGRIVTPFGPNVEPEYTKGIVFAANCGATLIKPSWVLSAAHCAGGVGNGVTSVRPNDNVIRAIDAAYQVPFSDAILFHIDSPYDDLPTIPFYAGSGASVDTQTMNVYGYGPTDPTVPPSGVPCTMNSQCVAPKVCNPNGWCVSPSPLFPVLKTADLVASRYPNPNLFVSYSNSSGQTTIKGDSGGPALIGGAIAGIVSYGPNSLAYTLYTNVAFLRSQLQTPSRVQYAVADFNKDGRSDYIVTTPSGSTWLQWTINGLTQIRTDSTLKLGKVSFTVGDFNGDGRSDFIQVTSSGASILYATATSGQFTLAASRSDWVYGTRFTTGNFDRETSAVRTDVAVTTDAGTSWYYNGAFSASPAFTRSDLNGSSSLTPGDFDGDGKTDLVVATPTGTQWLYANSTKTWNALGADQTRADLTVDSTEYVAGDFDGDHRSDLVITTSSGSYWYYATSVRGQWNEAYVRPDLALGTVKYIAADLDGNLKDDLLIVMPSGTYWYYSMGVGLWDDTSVGVRPDLTLGDVMYTVAQDDTPPGKDLIITTATGSYWYDSAGKTFVEARVTSDAL